MRGSLVALAGLVVAQDGGCDGGGGSGHRRLAGAGYSGRESELRTTLTCQKGSAGGGCPHRVLERAGRVAEGGRRRGRAETAGRRWWRGRKRVVSCVLDPRANSGRCCEGEPEVREVQGSLRREKFGGTRTHRRRCTGQFLVLQGWGRATVGSEVFLASGRSSCDGSRELGSGRVAASRRRRGPVRRGRVWRGVLGFGRLGRGGWGTGEAGDPVYRAAKA